MKTHTINTYSFNELSEEAKRKAIENSKTVTLNNGFAWSDEWIESITEGLKAYGAEPGRYSIDCLNATYSGYPFTHDADEDMTGQRLRTYILNNYYSALYCRKSYGKYKKRDSGHSRYDRYSKIQYKETDCPFTGYCGDEDFNQVIRNFIQSPDNRNMTELLQDAVYNTLKGLQNDCEYQLSDQYISECLEDSNYEFTEDGEIY